MEKLIIELKRQRHDLVVLKNMSTEDYVSFAVQLMINRIDYALIEAGDEK